MKKLLILGLTMFFFSGCATRFIKMNPELNFYSMEKNINKDVKIEYDFDAMSESRNNTYDYREDRKNLQLLSVKIKNESTETLVFTDENLKIKTLLGVPISIETNEDIYIHKIQQKRLGGYMLYGLAEASLNWTSPGNRYSLTINPIAVLIGVYNVALGIHGNSRFKKSMKTYNLFNQTVAPNTTFNGFIILNENIEKQELNFQYK